MYLKVMNESVAIQKQMRDKFGFQPKDKDFVVLYEGEKTDPDSGKLIVEMEKERPAFYSKNLMQKARAPIKDETTTTVKPSGLG